MGVLRRLEATLDTLDATVERNTRAFEDLQAVIRESRIREERALQSFERAMEELRADVRAHTEAIWRMLDRFGEGPQPAA